MAIRRPGASTLVPMSHRRRGTVLIDSRETDPRAAVRAVTYVILGGAEVNEVEVVDWRDDLADYPIEDLYGPRVVSTNVEFLRFLKENG